MLIGRLRAASRRSAEYTERHFFHIGLLCVFVVPLTTFIERVVSNPSYDTLWIRSAAGLVGSVLLVHRRLPPFLKDNFDIYWIFAVTYVLPFSFGLMLVLNAAYTSANESLSSTWIYQYLVALFFSVQLIHHGPLATILWMTASIIAVVPLALLESPNWSAVQEGLLLPLPIYVTAVVVGSLMNRNVAMVQTEKLKAVSAIGANLAHELRTPLASIRAVAQGADNLLPVLTDSYRKAKASGIPVAPLRESQVVNLSKALDTIKNEVAYSNTIIDMLLVNTADKPLAGVNRDRFGCRECIEEAVSRYPFNNQHERELIRIDVESDFEIIAPRLLIVHVLFNLIKNALYYVQQSGKGDILISARRLPESGQIVVHDDGMGIPPQVRQHIFERFYTTTRTGQGAGIGLSFCKMVMDAIGGTIQCDSVEGRYTTFTLGFPSVTR